MLRIFTKPDRNSQKLTAAVAIIQFPFSSALTGKPGKKKRMKVRRKKKNSSTHNSISKIDIISNNAMARQLNVYTKVCKISAI